MKKNPSLIFCLFLLFLIACQKQSTNLGIAQNYLPNSKLLQKGIVNKYYTHFLPAGKQEISTDMFYRSHQLSPTGSLLSKKYNPAFKNTGSKEWLFENNQTLLIKEVSYRGQVEDTFQSIITSPVIMNWASNVARSEKTIHYYEYSIIWEKEQTAIRDTIILDKPAVIFEEQVSYSSFVGSDTIPGNEVSYNKSIYVQDLGLYYYESINNSGKQWQELVEQIPMGTFNELANHGRERVAFIKAEDAIDKGADFKICGVRNHIYDYYNGSNLYWYQGGKRVIWDYMDNNLEESELMNESGYLTFRFIVNCKGEAGRFVTEQADFNFQRKEFNPATIAHCYELIRGLKDWSPTIERGEAVDAIFYFTFKLRNGELIDILPRF